MSYLVYAKLPDSQVEYTFDPQKRNVGIIGTIKTSQSFLAEKATLDEALDFAYMTLGKQPLEILYVGDHEGNLLRTLIHSELHQAIESRNEQVLRWKIRAFVYLAAGLLVAVNSRYPLNGWRLVYLLAFVGLDLLVATMFRPVEGCLIQLIILTLLSFLIAGVR